MLRRDFIKYSAAALSAASLGTYGWYRPLQAAETGADNPFSARLAIPPLLDKDSGAAEVSSYSLVVQISAIFSPRDPPTRSATTVPFWGRRFGFAMVKRSVSRYTTRSIRSPRFTGMACMCQLSGTAAPIR